MPTVINNIKTLIVIYKNRISYIALDRKIRSFSVTSIFVHEKALF